MNIDIDYGESPTKQRQRNYILQTAYMLFLKSNIATVSMQDIAKASKMQRRSLYNYYSKKEEIALDLMKCWYKNMEQIMVFDDITGETGYEIISKCFYAFYDRITQNTDMLAFSVDFDHYFRNSYDDAIFDEYVQVYFSSLHDVSLFKKGLADGSISKQYEGKEKETLITMSTSILSFAQRLMFRAEQLKKEGGHTPERIHILIELLLKAIRE